MYCFVGLGNPSREYQATRHNIGFDAITGISDAHKISLTTKKHKAVMGMGQMCGEKVILSQPQTFMNLSGESVQPMLDFYKIPASNLIVICDDINLPVGQLRIRAQGSDGGHNGLKNIIRHLGTNEFIRIRIGVGEKPKNWDLADYVLGRFSADEQQAMKEAIRETVSACETIVTQGIDKAMNQHNSKKKENT